MSNEDMHFSGGINNNKCAEELKAELKYTSDWYFRDLLFAYIDYRKMTDPEVYKASGIGSVTFNKIKNKKNYSPKKYNVVSLCIVLKLDLNQTKELIESAGYSFFPKANCFDLIIEFFIKRQIYDIDIINKTLLEYHQKLLGGVT